MLLMYVTVKQQGSGTINVLVIIFSYGGAKLQLGIAAATLIDKQQSVILD